MKPYLQHHNLTKLDVFISAFLSFTFTAAPQYISSGSFRFSGRAVVEFVLYIIILLFLAAGGRRLLLMGGSGEGSRGRILAFAENLLSRRMAVILIALLMFLFWLPVLIALYPGTAINDTWNQLYQFVYAFYSGRSGGIGGIQLRYLGDHHPVAATLIMGVTMIPLASATGNLQIAFFIYVLLQAFITCLAFSYTLVYMYRTLKVGTGFTMVCFLIYSLLPLFPSSAQLISKDSLTAWIFVFFTVMFMEMVRTGGASLDSRSNYEVLILTVWAMCATKKVGIYVAVISLLFVLPAIRRNRKKIELLIMGSILLFMVAWPWTMKFTGIVPGGRREMLSIPFQMTARYVKEHPDDITEEESEVIDKMLYMETLAERYDPVSADPVKGFAFYEIHNTSEYLDYIRVWFRQGCRHPGSYVNAFFAMESGWFSWTKYYPLLNMDWHSQLNTTVFSEASTVRPPVIKGLADDFQKMLDDLYENPLIRLIFTYAFYAALLPAFIIGTLFRKKRAADVSDEEQADAGKCTTLAWVAAVPMFLSIALGCWLAPVSIHFEGRRYLFPVVYTVVILLAWCRWWMKENSASSLTDC